jgi:branched-chain amino acid transport system permease protein
MNLFIYGVVNSFTLALIALGFTLVYGVSRLPNFAHGALYILTGFVTWTFLHKLGINYTAAVFLALIFTGLVGAAIYQLLLVRVRGMPDSEIMVSFAIGVAIMESLRWKGFVGSSFVLSPFIEGTVNLWNVPIDLQRIIIVGEGLVVVALLWLFTHQTKIGLALRAIAQDEHAAMMLGIDSDLMAVLALSLGSSLAGVAAIAILPLSNITVDTGYNVLIYAIAVCIVGGLGSWPGVVIAAFVIGFGQILTAAYIAPHYQMVVTLFLIIFTLIVRPSGFLGRQKEIEERV